MSTGKTSAESNSARGQNVLSQASSIEAFLMQQLELSSSLQPSTSLGASVAYHELAEFPVQNVDLVDQLERHVSELGNLQARLSFLNREIRYLMKV